MTKTTRRKVWLLAILICIFNTALFSQTSWRGTTSNSWATASNWTNGVPTATVDAIIGDASISSARYPTISATATCKSLTIGGAFTVKLTVSKNLTVAGSVTINTNGTLQQNKNTTISVQGNWTNTGTYTPNNSASIIAVAPQTALPKTSK